MKKNIGVDPISLIGLLIDLLVRIKSGNITMAQFTGFLKLSKKQRNQKFGILAVEETDHLSLKDDYVTVPALVSAFDPQEKFRHNKEVKYFLGGNFEKYVLNPTQPFNDAPEMSFSQYILKGTTNDNDIMSELEINPDRLLTRKQILWTIYELTNRQPQGQDGVLLTKNYDATIIGYFMCDDGVVRVAYVFWAADDGEWGCSCDELDGWHGGSEVLVCN